MIPGFQSLVLAAIAVGVTLPANICSDSAIPVEAITVLTVELPIDKVLTLLNKVEPFAANTISGPLVLPVFSVKSVVLLAVLIVVTLSVLISVPYEICDACWNKSFIIFQTHYNKL